MVRRLILMTLLFAATAAAQAPDASVAPKINLRMSGLIATAIGFGLLLLSGLIGAWRNQRAGRLITNGWRAGLLFVLADMGVYTIWGVSQGGEVIPWLVRGCGQGILPLLFGGFLAQRFAHQQEIETLRVAEKKTTRRSHPD